MSAIPKLQISTPEAQNPWTMGPPGINCECLGPRNGQKVAPRACYVRCSRPRFERQDQSMGVHHKVDAKPHHPKWRGHAQPWGFITPTPRAKSTHGSPSPQLEGPHESVVVRKPDLSDHARAWDSITLTKGTALNNGSPIPHLEGRSRRVVVHEPYYRGHTKSWVSLNPELRCHA